MSNSRKPPRPFAAISVEGAAGVNVSNNTIVGADTGILIRGVDSFTASNNRIFGVANSFDIQARQSKLDGNDVYQGSTASVDTAPSKVTSQLGYGERRGPPLPALCEKCQSIFPSRQYNIRSPLFYGFGNTETCRKIDCGGRAKVVDGIFNLSGDLIEIIKAEALTYAAVAAISDIATGVLNCSLDHADAVRRIEEISPGIGAKLRSYASSPLVLSWLTIFFAALPIALQYTFPKQDESCVIVKSHIMANERIELKLSATMDECFAYMGSPDAVRVFDQTRTQSLSKAIDRVGEKKRSGQVGNIDGDFDSELNADLQLPLAGPIPSKKPHRLKHGNTKERFSRFGRSRTR